ncbi:MULTISPECIES: YfcC family protein [unclassified Romboutsia]|uniref:YfcC family protein n=1 Tax=unclassified Romboutsia TaxID=2626894 RepID=UPI00082178B3|nr:MULTISPECIES: YfcC family protein [unclassified Romboutsia]SCH04972.1 C4-dicarboxylate anaerobic carrier [uncultured Clostridium sp.]
MQLTLENKSDSNVKKSKKIKLPTAYTILFSIIVIIAIITHIIPGVIPATISDVVMAPMNGLKDAIDICVYVLLMGGFLNIVTKTGALDAGIGEIVKKLNGKELLLIPILMFILSLGGTSFGMAEETLAFYALVTATMMAAGFDSLTAVATILLGAGVGVLGSTVNPFLVATSVDSLKGVGVEVNQAIVMGIGTTLWASSLLISIYFVMKYAKKVKDNNANSLLSKDELKNSKEAFLEGKEDVPEFTTKRKIVMAIFAVAFIVMVLGVIPWERFGITIFSHTDFLTGVSLGNWWFSELGMWFVLMSILVGLVYGFKEKDIVSYIIEGAGDMVGVALIIGISRGVSVIMSSTGLDAQVLNSASSALSGMSPILFTNVAFLIYIALSFLIPSTSGLASVSIPIFGALAHKLGFSPELVISILGAGCGLVNLITPTSGVVMGGLAIAKVEYGTWIKFATKVIVCIFISSAIILSVGMMLL